MEYSLWASTMPYPNPPQTANQFSVHHYPPTLYSSSSSSHYSQNPNPISTVPTLNPPGIDPFLSHSSYPHSHHSSPYEAIQASAMAYAQYGSAALPAPASYPDAVLVQNWSVKELVQQYGGTVPQNGTQQLVPATSIPTLWTNPTVQPRGPWKKGPKKIKVAQSQFCEVCKIVCNTKEVLDKHKSGKKHLKNVEKHNKATAPSSASAAVPNKPAIGPQENPGSISVQKRIKPPETAVDLETKRRKVMEGGAAASAVRSCAICNVVCNSDTVFKYHLAGQKHVSMVKKLTGGTGLAPAT